MRSLRGPDKKPPPLMDPTRERDRGRILQLFKPYRVRLTIVLAMIVFSAGLAMLQPFLLRGVLDQGIVEHNDPREGATRYKRTVKSEQDTDSRAERFSSS